MILGREVRSFFATPAGWMILAVFSVVAGLIFVGLLIRYRQASLSLMQAGQVRSGDLGLHVNDWVVRPYLFNLGSVLLFFIPLLTMRSLAEERRTGSLELLLSLPVRSRELIVGKFLGAAGVMLALLLIVPVHGVILALISTPDWGAAGVGCLGLFMTGLLMLSIGLLVSVFSQGQIEAGVLTLGVLLLLGLGPGVAEAASPTLARLLSFVGILDRFEDFTRGVIDLRHMAFLAGGMLLTLAVALRGIDMVRWRGV